MVGSWGITQCHLKGGGLLITFYPCFLIVWPLSRCSLCLGFIWCLIEMAHTTRLPRFFEHNLIIVIIIIVFLILIINIKTHKKKYYICPYLSPTFFIHPLPLSSLIFMMIVSSLLYRFKGLKFQQNILHPYFPFLKWSIDFNPCFHFQMVTSTSFLLFKYFDFFN